MEAPVTRWDAGKGNPGRVTLWLRAALGPPSCSSVLSVSTCPGTCWAELLRPLGKHARGRDRPAV